MTTSDLLDSRDDLSALVQAGDLQIDPETGEVSGWSAATDTEQFAYLTRICAEAQAVIKAQEAIYNAARAALERLLLERGEQSVKTPYGTPSLRTRTVRDGRPDRVVEVVRRYELSREQEQLIWMCATRLDAKELDALAEAGVLPAEAVASLIEAKTSSFVQVVLPRTNHTSQG